MYIYKTFECSKEYFRIVFDALNLIIEYNKLMHSNDNNNQCSVQRLHSYISRWIYPLFIQFTY